MDWEQQYRAGQGRYFPNEELIRFLGRTYGSVVHKKATGLTAIEIGCGVGGNVWALTEWGFFGYGLELSAEAIKQARDHAKRHGFEYVAEYKQYLAPAPIALPSRSVQLVIDIQTIQHMPEEDHKAMYKELYRVLAPGGRFFSVHWCAGVAAKYIFPEHSELCQWTRFHVFQFSKWLEAEGFKTPQVHIAGRTYHNVIEPAEWVVMEAVKP